jgi:hypothetical protein
VVAKSNFSGHSRPIHFTWREITARPAEVAASIRAAFLAGMRQVRGPAA